MQGVTEVLNSMLGWVTTIITSFVGNDVLKLFIYIPIATSVILVVIGIIAYLFGTVKKHNS